MRQLVIAKRFCGPPTSANGGYFCGLVAALRDGVSTIDLLKPPPLDTPLMVDEATDGVLRIRLGPDLLAESRLAALNLLAPLPTSHLEAVEASRHCAGFVKHPYPTCFVCGSQRERGDGLRIFPGELPGRQIVAAPWIPDASLGRNGKVRAEFMWAALDCPGFFAANPQMGPLLLAQFTAHVDRLVHVGEQCTVIGWRIGGEGRKHEAGTALFDDDNELCGLARALWIEPRRQ
jgi:hypothetical protein